MRRSLSRVALPAFLALAFAPKALADEPAKPADAPAPAAAEEKGVAFEAGTPPWADVLAKAKAEKKSVFIDFATVWCGWCKKLDKDTFSKAEVASVMTAFVCVHVDAEKGEGVGLAKKYGANGFPTLVVVDAEGGEIDRIVGYMPPEKFVPEMQRIARGEGTLPALKKKADETPGDLGCQVAYAEKLVLSDAPGAAKRLHAIAETLVSPDAEVEARKWLVLGIAVQADAAQSLSRESALDLYAKVATEFAGTKAAADALRRGAGIAYSMEPDRAQAFFDAAKKAAKTDKDRALVDGMTFTLHLQLAANALKSQGDAAAAEGDAQALNQVAWIFYEHRQDMPFRRYLGLAADFAKKAVEISKRDPAILDTWACLLFATGKIDDAIATEEEALGKVQGDSMKAEFAKNVADWKKARDERKAKSTGPAAH